MASRTEAAERHGAREAIAGITAAMVGALDAAELRALAEAVRNETRRRRRAIKAARALYAGMFPWDAGARLRCTWDGASRFGVGSVAVEVRGRAVICTFRYNGVGEAVVDDQSGSRAFVGSDGKVTVVLGGAPGDERDRDAEEIEEAAS